MVWSLTVASLRNRLLDVIAAPRGDYSGVLSWESVQVSYRSMDSCELSVRTTYGLRDPDAGYGGAGWTTCHVGGKGVSSLSCALDGGLGCECPVP